MPEQTNFVWVRTRITPRTKQLARDTAAILGWTIPGAECAALELMFSIFTPQELADHVSEALRTAELDVVENEQAN